MASEEDIPVAPPHGWSHDPEQWTDPQLFSLSLSELSKALTEYCPYISQHRVLDTYLRWLEVHRVSPTAATTPWQDALEQWAVDLRAHCFKKDELMKKVKIWKDENGPFHSQYRRYPPMPYDIAKAWPELVYVLPLRPKKEDYSGTPPGNYICNRCNLRGKSTWRTSLS